MNFSKPTTLIEQEPTSLLSLDDTSLRVKLLWGRELTVCLFWGAIICTVRIFSFGFFGACCLLLVACAVIGECVPKCHPSVNVTGRLKKEETKKTGVRVKR